MSIDDFLNPAEIEALGSHLELGADLEAALCEAFQNIAFALSYDEAC